MERGFEKGVAVVVSPAEDVIKTSPQSEIATNLPIKQIHVNKDTGHIVFTFDDGE